LRFNAAGCDDNPRDCESLPQMRPKRDRNAITKNPPRRLCVSLLDELFNDGWMEESRGVRLVKPKFELGDSLYYKPGAFAPLQVSAGGMCTVIEIVPHDGRAFDYRIKLESDEERTVLESELTEQPAPKSDDRPF
jgi:hypothetical protein